MDELDEYEEYESEEECDDQMNENDEENEGESDYKIKILIHDILSEYISRDTYNIVFSYFD